MFLSHKPSFLFKELVLKSWWTLLFFLVALFCYDKATKRRGAEETILREKLEYLQLSKVKAEELQLELKLQIASQKDAAWIELVLMQKLGLVPEGQTKVYFKCR